MTTKPLKAFAHHLDGLDGKKENKWWSSIYPSKTLVRMCGNYPIHEVIVREVREGETSEYWAWWDNEDQEFMFIYPSKTQVNMCFTYGPEVKEKAGRGLRVNVIIELVE